jgi:hypothetical protein
MDSKERNVILRALANQLGNILSSTSKPWKGDVGTWSFTPPEDEATNWMVHIDRADGAKLYLQLHSSKGYDLCDRLHVQGSLNIGRNREYVQVYERGPSGTGWDRCINPDITVALSRGAEAIAKEITRRLLPEYLRIYALAVAKLQDDNAYDTKVDNNLRILAKAIGTVLPAKKQDPNNSYVEKQRTSFTFNHGEVYGDITASNKTAELKLRCLTINQAEHILAYIKGGKK